MQAATPDLLITQHRVLDEAVLDALVSLDARIFPKPLTRDAFEHELASRRGLLVLLASVEGVACGYKAGFEQYAHTFFSFSGGVVPERRRQGIATALMIEQHRILNETGYRLVRTHTKNTYRRMLAFNITFGFDVIGVHKGLADKHQTIVLEKMLDTTE